jgi:Signal transduction histidine kinase
VLLSSAGFSLVRIPHTNLTASEPAGRSVTPKESIVRGGGRSVIVPVRTTSRRATRQEEHFPGGTSDDRQRRSASGILLVAVTEAPFHSILRLPPKLGVTHVELWRDVQHALAAYCARRHLRGAVVYLARHNDYLAFQRVASTTDDAGDSLALPSYDTFTWILEQESVTLPTDKQELSWLDPATQFHAPHGVLLAHETIGGNLLLLSFLTVRRPTAHVSHQLQQFANYEVFPYVATAMFGIELDFLTAEIGHLMGRAVGKISVGLHSLRTALADCKADNPEDVALAYQATDDGLRRLELIRANFYHFGAQRRATGQDTLMRDVSDEVFDVMPVLKEMANTFRSDVVRTRLKAPVTKLSTRHARVRGPRDLLRIAFLNLYDNAVKFAYADTYVTIAALVTDEQCVVTFENLGVGVAPDEFAAVFQRLRRSRFRDPARRIEGLGLGLAYCRRVIEEVFHGRITLTSRPVDTPAKRRFEGDNWLTTVTVELPLAPPET